MALMGVTNVTMTMLFDVSPSIEVIVAAVADRALFV